MGGREAGKLIISSVLTRPDFVARYIAVEGCLAVGKTTMARELAKRLGAEVLTEDFSRHPFLDEFYIDPKANGLETELAFAIIHYHTIADAVRRGKFRKDVVTDFFYEKTWIFHQVTLSPKKDAQVFMGLWSSLRKRVPTPDLVVYLDARTEFLLKRLRRRAREYERPVTYQYLDAVNRAYRRFMSNYKASPVLQLEAERLDTQAHPDPFGEVAAEVRRMLAVPA